MRTPVDQSASQSVRHVPDFADLLQRALTEPGVISQAYTAFHGYSIGNQLLALVQVGSNQQPYG